MDRLAGWLTWLLDGAARLLPSNRRQWVEAVRAEAGQVPAGRQRLSWIAGGLWLAVKEAHMARKIGYWLGVGAIVAMGAWAAWMSLLAAPASDIEALTDRVRVLVLLTTLIGLPWLARGRGLFGPVGPSVVTRFTRIAGCAAICGLGLLIVHRDTHTAVSFIGNGTFNPAEEFCGLVALAAAVVVPLIIRARWRQAGREAPWCVAACGVVTALVLIPLQLLPVAYLMLIMAATARRSPVRPATLAAGIIGGLADGLIGRAMQNFPEVPLLIISISLLAALICTMSAGAGAAWMMRETGSEEDLRAAQIRQGMFAGITAGAVGGMASTFFVLFFVFMMVLGPLTGVLGGRSGAGLAADYLPKRRAGRSISAGLFISD
ncbi:MAG TPA: hypothetical protein VGM14_29955 [Streptosporangiaceae bacterium]|jgi:hypothetical protein